MILPSASLNDPAPLSNAEIAPARLDGYEVVGISARQHAWIEWRIIVTGPRWPRTSARGRLRPGWTERRVALELPPPCGVSG